MTDMIRLAADRPPVCEDTPTGSTAAARPASARILVVGTMASRSGAPIAALRLAAGLSGSGHEVQALFLYRREGVGSGEFSGRGLVGLPPRGPF